MSHCFHEQQLSAFGLAYGWLGSNCVFVKITFQELNESRELGLTQWDNLRQMAIHFLRGRIMFTLFVANNSYMSYHPDDIFAHHYPCSLLLLNISESEIALKSSLLNSILFWFSNSSLWAHLSWEAMSFLFPLPPLGLPQLPVLLVLCWCICYMSSYKAVRQKWDGVSLLPISYPRALPYTFNQSTGDNWRTSLPPS